MRIEDALHRFVTQLEADGRSCHTIHQYERHVRALARWLAPCGEIGRIDHELLARFLASPVARTRADGRSKKATSSNCLRSSLRGFFSYLAAAGIIDRDPSRLIRRARCGTSPPKALSEEEQHRLLEMLASKKGTDARRDHVLFALMLGSGIRVGSAVALDVEDVDLAQKELWLRRTKGDRPDRVMLSRELCRLLADYTAERRAGPLFQGRRGKRITTRHVSRLLALSLEAAGIQRKATPHTLRTTFATEIYRKTGDIMMVKIALQHRSLNSTLHYAQLEPERLRRAIAGRL